MKRSIATARKIAAAALAAAALAAAGCGATNCASTTAGCGPASAPAPAISKKAALDKINDKAALVS